MRSGRRGKRKWTPEPGASQPPMERTRVQPPARPHRGAEGPPDPPPARPSAPPPTADEAPTGVGPMPTDGDQRGHARQQAQQQGPTRGARPYPPRPWEAPAGDYERYDTGGYAPGQPRPDGTSGRQGAPPDGNVPPDDQPTEHGFDAGPGGPRVPKKLTVTRVAALRGRELSGRAVGAFQRATKADGADRSGLTSLTYATMLNYASDAAMAVALANTLFFAASSGESRGKVALYLLITIAPFALVAPVVGPALDRIQRGRRLAMAVASAGQALMCVLMALNFDTWMLYPAALGKMVLSKSFMVLKAAVTPRVLPPEITLSKTNARLTVFGLAAGGAFGAVAAGFNSMFGSSGALWFTAVICVAGTVQAMRIPSWVEVTEGEVPASLTMHTPRPTNSPQKRKRQPMGKPIVVALWGNATIRLLTGFLMMFAAFAVKEETEHGNYSPFMQLVMLGVIGAAAGAGGFLGNAIGSRLHVGRSDQMMLICAGSALGSTVLATVLPGLLTAAIVGLVGATASALAKNNLDAVIQDGLPEESRASAFGRSETVLQLAWVFGGAVGLLLPPTYWIGFLTVSVLLAVGLAQTWLVRNGSSLVPGVGGNRPVRPGTTSAHDRS